MPAWKTFLRIFSFLISVLIIISTVSCANLGKQKLPAKVYPVVNVSDGEYLVYGYYVGGEKSSESYMVTKKETGKNGELFYKVYGVQAKSPADRKIPDNYKEWPSFYIIDPWQGSVIEAVYSIKTSDIKDIDPANPYSSLIYSHYKLHRDSGYVEYTSKSLKNKELIEKNYRVNIKKDYPVCDANSTFYFPTRFLDVRNGGILYMVSPEFLKDPVPFSFKYESRETIRTKAGQFAAIKGAVVSGDPFIGQLVGPLLKKFAIWYEDSDRRLTVKIQLAYGGYMELEEISNVR